MIDVGSSRELQATILALRQAESAVARNINKDARTQIRPVWQGELNARTRSAVEARVISQGARVAVGQRGVTFYAATSSRPLSNGLVPSTEWAGFEFGATTRTKTVSQRSRKGKRYNRETTVNRQFRARQRQGVIAMDAASVAGTRLVAMWVRTTVDQFKAIPAVEVVG